MPMIAHTAQTVSAFVAIDRALANAGVSRCRRSSRRISTRAFCSPSHLGDGSFLVDGEPVAERYAAAAELLAELHRRYKAAARLRKRPGSSARHAALRS